MSVNLDPYRAGDGPLHRLDARIKLILALGVILTAALLPDGAWAAWCTLLVFILAGAALDGPGIPTLLKRGLLALPFALAALPLVFDPAGPVAVQFSLAGREVTLSQPGLVRFASIAARSWVSVQAAALLAAVTPFPELLAAMRALRVPRLLVAVIGLMWRYLFLMADTAGQLLRARDSRSTDAGRPGLRRGGSLAWRARVTGGMAGSLLLRSIERGDRVYAAMLARGYDGEARSLPPAAVGLREWGTLAAGLAVLGMILVLGWLAAG